jgi:hypothetical protein
LIDLFLKLDIFIRLSTGCKTLEVIKLRGNYHLLTSGIEALAQTNPLRELYVEGLKIVTDTTIQNVCMKSKYLETLNLRSTMVTDVGLGFVAQYLSVRLKILRIKFLNISDAGIQNICTSCPNLLELDLQGFKLITDSSLSAIGQNCTNLNRYF